MKNSERFHKKSIDLNSLYNEDQLDRISELWKKDPELMQKRDEERLKNVLKLVKNNKLVDSSDYLQTAMLLQHGTELKHYEMAHELVKKALEMGHQSKDDEPDILWLVAATKDRALMFADKPQLYGTQYRMGEDGLWYLWDVDESITDDERANMHVESLAEAKAAVDEMNN